MKNLKKPLIYCLLSAISLYACVPLEESKAVSAAEVSDTSFYTFPAEFEKHEAIWIKWTTETYFRKSTLVAVKEIVNALAPYIKVKLVVKNEDEKMQAIAVMQKEEIPYSHVEFIVNPYCVNRWVRDSGPIFLKNNEGKFKIVDFGFNRYGTLSQTDSISLSMGSDDIAVARMYDLPLVRSSLVSEGGDREFNGKGTLMVTESVEMQRNPGMTKEEIETEFKRVLGQKKIIWLKTGPIEGDQMDTKGALPGNIFTSTTCGHIDEYARFTDSNTILLAQVSEKESKSNPILAKTYEVLEENYRILKESTDQDGNPFKIIRIPVTDHYFDSYVFDSKLYWLKDLRYFDDGRPVKDGDPIQQIIASSYLNFLVTNGCVLVAAYYKEGMPESTKQKDSEAANILRKVFPGRDIIQIYEIDNVNSGGGGIHCITQQEPVRLTGN